MDVIKMEYQSMSFALRKVAAEAHNSNKANFERQRDMIDELFGGVRASMDNQQDRLVELIEHFGVTPTSPTHGDVPETHDVSDMDNHPHMSADVGGNGTEGVPEHEHSGNVHDAVDDVIAAFFGG